ncbi:MAG: hypothetical protein GAK34_03580 [Delftia tsuruhatensis]|nr:MAG: hypothetical protein GAK34_03580 [Delftia tsuruhatensis]
MAAVRQCEAQRQVLAGQGGHRGHAIGRLQVERADGGTLIHGLRHPERPPLPPQPGGGQALAGIGPASGHLQVGRPAVGRHAPAQRQGVGPAHDAAGLEGPQALGALEGGDFRGVKDDAGLARHLQHFSGFGVDEQQARLGIDQEVAQGHEEQVAREVGDGQRSIGVDPHKARLAATVGDIDLAQAIIPINVGRHVERIRLRNQGLCARVQRCQFDRRHLRRLPGRPDKPDAAVLDIARAVAEALDHADVEGARPINARLAPHRAVESVAPARHGVHAQQAHGMAVAQARLGRVGRITARRHMQGRWIGRVQEARLAGPYRGPGVALRIHAAQHHEMQQRVELAVLVQQEGAHKLAARHVHAAHDANALLDRQFARMPGRGGVLQGLRVHGALLCRGFRGGVAQALRPAGRPVSGRMPRSPAAPRCGPARRALRGRVAGPHCPRARWRCSCTGPRRQSWAWRR